MEKQETELMPLKETAVENTDSPKIDFSSFGGFGNRRARRKMMKAFKMLRPSEKYRDESGENKTFVQKLWSHLQKTAAAGKMMFNMNKEANEKYLAACEEWRQENKHKRG